ncbi:hypothetical protein [Dyadobacter pollutisoli]|jgi:hypothetical protein|uniref:Uncharacterized protein n=1 Tax=Dyadobacter pollutisoli TaxID=2910158 RepID=A0A9E8N9H3_9BACT|nr:hypothetical protein [Dyadobacter pollutisoli]WAC10377.1 hypothetical protein ON006_21790 [Dyadobacter pollutisoli]
MAWTVILEDENKNDIELLEQEFSMVNLNNSEKETFKLLKYLDPYGDTIFNNLQMSDLISDLIYLKGIEQNNELINLIIELAKKCQSDNHCYIAFYGD